MKLRELLREEKYGAFRTPIDTVEELAEVAKSNCQDALKTAQLPIIRGTRSGEFEVGGVYHGAKGSRSSRNTTNFYTVILDELLGRRNGYPLRSASIICGNYENEHAREYGALFYIFPFNKVKVGVCPDEDIWETQVKLGNTNRVDIAALNDAFEYFTGFKRGADFTYVELIKELKAYREENEGDEDKLYRFNRFFPPGKDIEECIEQAYLEPDWDLATTANPTYNDGAAHELWIGGPCLAVAEESGEQFYKLLELKEHL